MSDPLQRIREWLPHVMVLLTLAAGVGLLIWILLPLLEPILLAAALALLTTPVLFVPIRGYVARWFPGFAHKHPWLLDRVAAALAVAVLALLCLLPLLALVLGTIESPWQLVQMMWGLVWQEEQAFGQLSQVIIAQVEIFDQLYPALQLNPAALAQQVVDMVREAVNFGPQVLGFVFSGTGIVVHLVLGTMILAYLYIYGPRLSRGVLQFSPQFIATGRTRTTSPTSGDAFVNRHGRRSDRQRVGHWCAHLVDRSHLGYRDLTGGTSCDYGGIFELIAARWSDAGLDSDCVDPAE